MFVYSVGTTVRKTQKVTSYSIITEFPVAFSIVELHNKNVTSRYNAFSFGELKSP